MELERVLPPEYPLYHYAELTDSTRDIRLLNLLPGQSDDPLQVTMEHVTPKELYSSSSKFHEFKFLDFQHLKAALPSGWDVKRVTGGRLLFIQKRGDSWETGFTTLTHPDPSVPRCRYDHLVEAAPRVNPNWEALSYTWGSAGHPVPVEVVEFSLPETLSTHSISTLLIQRNLALALRHLRRPDEKRTLWVDAVCINQDNEAERNEQVRRMASIYSNASRVVIWLGQKEDGSERAMKALEYIGQQLVSAESFSLTLRTPEAKERDWCDPLLCHLPCKEETWESIEKLITRPWFSRRWVVQEALLGSGQSIVQCGDTEIAWALFCNAVATLVFRPYLSLSLWQAAETLLHFGFEYKFKSLCSHLSRFYGKQCQDDRDRIYALLGLASV